MSDEEELEAARRQLEVAANNFAMRTARMAHVRSEYVSQIAEMSNSIRSAVDAGELSARAGAEIANQMRNQILEMQRLRDFDLGRSLAQSMKQKGLSLEEVITKVMKDLNLEGRQFNQLSGSQQRQVYMEVINSAGRSRPSVTRPIPYLRWTGRTLWFATFVIAAYNIGTAENPWWQTGRESSNIAGGIGGAAAAGALAGLWAGPIGVGIGILVGGALGALLADHAYVEAVGTSDESTRSFVDRFTGFFTGVDEAGMAQALASEHLTDSSFTERVFLSLNNSYYTDSDDVALEYVNAVRQNLELRQALMRNNNLRELLIHSLESGWTSSEEQRAIWYLQSLPYGQSNP